MRMLELTEITQLNFYPELVYWFNTGADYIKCYLYKT